jgi:hypothetical protein
VDGTTGLIKVVYAGGEDFLPEDITVGPDNRLYVCDATNGRILRMDQDGKKVETVFDQATSPASQAPGGPQGPRFSSTGTLFFNTKNTNGSNPSGVWKIDGLAAIPSGGRFPAPVKVLSATDSGEGLAFRNNGDLLVINRGLGEVQRSLSPDLMSTQAIVTGLTDPIGVAVNSVDDIFVARGNSLNGIQRFTVTSKGVASTPYVNFDPADLPIYFEFNSEDTLFVTTADATLQNGKLWRVAPPVAPNTTGSKTLLAALPKCKGKVPPAVGVGIPATSRSITKKDFTGTQAYNFGFSSYEVTAGLCTATITARQRPPAEVNAMLSAAGIKGKGQPLSGEEGWVTTWLVEPSPAGCLPGPDGTFGIAIAAFVNAPFKISPGIVKCNGSPTVCEQLPDFGYYPQGTILGLPGDPVTSTKSKSFSEYLFVNLELAQNGNFCGFQPPLSSDPDRSRVFNSGQTIPFKFQLMTGANCTGSFITDAKAVLSVAQIESGNGKALFDRKVIDASGSSNDPPAFRNDGANYLFNLKTSKGWTAGLYAATVTSNKFFPQTILFRLR